MNSKQYMSYLGYLLVMLSITDITGAIMNCVLDFEKINELVIQFNISKELLLTIIIIVTSITIIIASLKFFCGIKGILEAKGKNKSEKYIKIAKVIFIISIAFVVFKWIQVFTINNKFVFASISTVSVVVLYQFIAFSKVFIQKRLKTN